MPDLRALAARLRDLDASRFHVVTLPDFYLDHFVRAPAWADAEAAWRQVHARGGGSVPTPGQHFQPGGNAANAALALARLGVRVHLVARTSAFGKAYLADTMGRMGVDLQFVRGDGRLAVTTALEFHEARPVNVMLSDPGSVAEHGPETLDANEWTLLEAADLVLVANWSQNRRGTALVEAVCRKAAEAGTLTMLDTADPSVRGPDAAAGIQELRERILPLETLDVYALNENELRQLAGKQLGGTLEERAAARELHALRGGRILELHTARFAASYGPWGEAVAPTFLVEPLRVTGAGDAWNAGAALGHLAGLAPEERLVLANAVAGLYVSGKEGVAPTLPEVAAFLEGEPPLTPVAG